MMDSAVALRPHRASPCPQPCLQSPISVPLPLSSFLSPCSPLPLSFPPTLSLPHLPPLPGDVGAPGPAQAQRPPQRPLHGGRGGGPVPSRLPEEQPLRYQLLHVHRSGRTHRRAEGAPEEHAAAHHAAAAAAAGSRGGEERQWE